MNIDENESHNNLICPGCNDKYTDPQQLPCGQSLCNYCIQTIEKNEFKCALCNNIHQKPVNGFPLNDQLIQQLNKRLKTESSNEAQQFKTLSNNIDTKLKQAEFDLANGDYIIKEHCRELRREVQLAKEIKIEQIQKLSEEMLSQIDSYEQDRITAYLKSKKEPFTLKLNDFKAELLNWNQNLDKLLTRDQYLTNETDSARNMLSNLAIEKENIQNLVYDDKILEFFKKREEHNENVMGRLILNSFKIIDFNKIDKIDLNQYFDQTNEEEEDEKTTEIIDSFTLDNNDFVIFVFQNSGLKQMKALLFDENKTLKKTKTLNVSACGTIYSSANRLCVQYAINKSNYLCVLNEKLEPLTQIEINKQRLVGSNDSSIFLTTDPKSETSIVVYDWSLKLVKEFGQKTQRTEPYYLRNVYGFQVKNDKYYVIDNNSLGDRSLKIIDEKSGVLLNSISIDRISLFNIDADNRLILVNSDKLVYLNQNGHLLKEIKLVNFPDYVYSYWSIDKNNDLHIFEEENYWLSIKKLQY